MRRWRLGIVLVFCACRGASFEQPPNENRVEGAPTESVGGAEPAEPAGLAESAPDGGVTTQNRPEVSVPELETGTGGASDTAAGCGAEPVTLDEIHSGRVRNTVAVAVGPLVASSQKFLVSEAKSGSCLWGAFAAEPGRSGAGSGLFLVSYGAPHSEGEGCASGSDGLPDDLAPGDSLRVEGRLDEYAPATCEGTVPALQLRIDAACPALRGEATAAPEPAVLERALADRLAAGKDAQLLREWGGALVRLEDVSALQDTEDGDAVMPFGVIRLAETALEVHSRLYYFDLTEGGPRAAVKSPRYAFPTAFRKLSGVVFLDYCTWTLGPRARCADLSPPSQGCGG